MLRLFTVLTIGSLILAARAPARRGPLVLAKADNGKAFEVAKGARFTVSLRGNPTTGFVWETKALKTAIVKQLGNYQFKSDSTAAGAGGTLTFEFEAVGVGQTTLTLIYHRPFEVDTPPTDTFEVTLSVK